MIGISDLPAVNAILNGTSAALLLTGFYFIRHRRVTAHKICMLSAFVTSIIFLASYLTLRYFAGFTAFAGQGWVRPVYFTILISHTVLAATIPPLALTLLYRVFREQFARHRRLARWTLPVWLYVSVTGVIVYWMLYHLYPAGPTPHVASPEEVLKRYVAVVYARDYPAAYELISVEDRRLKTREEYVRESGAFAGAALDVTRALAAYIRYEELRTVIQGDRATVSVKAVLPNANDPMIDTLLLGFDEERLAAQAPAARRAMLEKLAEMARSGRLPVIVGENEKWGLVREDGTWRVFLNWAGAVVVRFEGVAKAGLPWAFGPVQPVVRAKPGETLQTFYRVKNLSDREITGKARHVLDPPEETGHLQIVRCFCFIQQTLKPGESRELPVVFRVSSGLPSPIREMRVRYEFYPLERFPAGRRK